MRPPGAASLAHNLCNCGAIPRETGGTLFPMPPTSQQRWDGGHARSLPQFRLQLKKNTWVGGVETTWLGGFASHCSPDPSVRSPRRIWGGKSSWGGEKDRPKPRDRRRGGRGWVYPPAGLREGPGPQPQLHLLGTGDEGPSTVRREGEPHGERRLPGLSSPQLPGGQKCPFRRSPELKSRQKRPSEVIFLAEVNCKRYTEQEDDREAMGVLWGRGEDEIKTELKKKG